MKYNPDIRHRRSIRLKGYDYSQAGLYFITICIQDRKCLFGEIVGIENSQPEMVLNDAGKIADKYWLEIPKHFPNAVLHEHMIMPNHVHGIIELKRVDQIPNQIANNDGTRHVVSVRNQFSHPIPGSVSVIVQQYKSSVKRICNKNDFSHFRWQSRFYEHIIRNEQSYEQIAYYIMNNPENWKEDKFFNG